MRKNIATIGSVVTVERGWVAELLPLHAKGPHRLIVMGQRRDEAEHQDLAVCSYRGERVELTRAMLYTSSVTVSNPPWQDVFHVQPTKAGKNGRKGYMVTTNSDEWAVGGCLYSSKVKAEIEKRVLSGVVKRENANKALVRMAIDGLPDDWRA